MMEAEIIAETLVNFWKHVGTTHVHSVGYGFWNFIIYILFQILFCVR